MIAADIPVAAGTFVAGVVVGVILASVKSSRSLDLDWRLRIRRMDKRKEEDDSSHHDQA